MDTALHGSNSRMFGICRHICKQCAFQALLIFENISSAYQTGSGSLLSFNDVRCPAIASIHKQKGAMSRHLQFRNLFFSQNLDRWIAIPPLPTCRLM